MKKNPMKIAASVFVIVSVIFMLSIFTRIITKNIIVEKLKINNSMTQFIMKGMSVMDAMDEVTGEFYTDIDWEKLYPFKQDKDIGDDVTTVVPEKKGFWDKYKDKVCHIENVLQDYCDEYLVGRVKFVEQAYAFEKLFQWTLIPYGSANGIIVKDDGYMTYVSEAIGVTDMASHIDELNGYLEEREIDMLYVQAPSKIDPINPGLPPGVMDYTNDNIDNLLKELAAKGIDVLDLRQFIIDEYDNYEDAFYKTDHHWKTTTAFRAAQILVEYMNKQGYTSIDENKIATDKFEIETYEKYFLGSQGKKVTLAVAEPEDYHLMVPKYDTDFTIKIPERNIDMTGEFQDTLLDYRHLQRIDYYNENCYASFMNRNDVYGKIINHASDVDDKKILIIKDSYSTPFIPYLALGVKEVDSIYKMLFDGSIQTYIEETEPDIVIVMYSVTSMSEDVSSRSAFFNLE